MSEEKQPKNTTKQLSNAELSLEVKRLRGTIQNEKKAKVSIPKVLEPQLGKSLFVSVNGSEVYIPVDGEDYEVPVTLAKHVKDYIKNLT